MAVSAQDSARRAIMPGQLRLPRPGVGVTRGGPQPIVTARRTRLDLPRGPQDQDQDPARSPRLAAADSQKSELVRRARVGARGDQGPTAAVFLAPSLPTTTRRGCIERDLLRPLTYLCLYCQASDALEWASISLLHRRKRARIPQLRGGPSFDRCGLVRRGRIGRQRPGRCGPGFCRRANRPPDHSPSAGHPGWRQGTACNIRLPVPSDGRFAGTALLPAGADSERI